MNLQGCEVMELWDCGVAGGNAPPSRLDLVQVGLIGLISCLSGDIGIRNGSLLPVSALFG